MSCDADSARSPSRRSPLGWALLGVIIGLVGFYGFALSRIAVPRVDEAYARTFMTREFAVFPRSAEFLEKRERRDGLSYDLGTRVDLTGTRARFHMARFDWRKFDPVKPYLVSFVGRVFVHIPQDQRRPDASHRLRLAMTCRMPAGSPATLSISVNGQPHGTVPCETGSQIFSTTLPPGSIGMRAYDEIRIGRAPSGLGERVATRLGLRYDAVSLDWFEITTGAGTTSEEAR